MYVNLYNEIVNFSLKIWINYYLLNNFVDFHNWILEIFFFIESRKILKRTHQLNCNKSIIFSNNFGLCKNIDWDKSIISYFIVCYSLNIIIIYFSRVNKYWKVKMIIKICSNQDY